MNRIIVILLIAFIHTSTLFAQWEIMNEAMGGRYVNQLFCMDFINENVGWLARENLYKTIDGGESWEFIDPTLINSGSDIDYFRSIDLVSDTLAWASIRLSNGNYSVAKSVDGGITWLAQDLIFHDLAFISVIDEINVFICEEYQRIIRTMDGGKNWIDITPVLPSPDHKVLRAEFATPELGIVSSYFSNDQNSYTEFCKTTDGGNNWTSTLVDSANNLSEIKFINDSTGYFIGDYKLFKTSDSFRSFTQILDPPETWWSRGLKIFHATKSNSIFAPYVDTTVTYKMFYSSNGGVEWSSNTGINYGAPVDIVFPSDSIGYFLLNHNAGARGNNAGILLKSTDSGKNWSSKFLFFPLQSVSYMSEDYGIACGGHEAMHDLDFSNVFITKNGGKSWQLSYSDNKAGLFSKCRMYDDSLFVAAAGGGVYKTIDGGKKWDIIYRSEENPMDSISDFHFIDNRTGWLVGKRSSNGYAKGIILFNENSSENWKVSECGDVLSSVYFNNDSYGWAVGENGTILKYDTDNGWVRVNMNTTKDLIKVFYISDQTGFIAGSDGILLRTLDGGNTWNETLNFNYQIKDISINSKGIGWSINSNSRDLYYTNDFGETWIDEHIEIESKLNSIAVYDSFAVAVGEGGLVLRTTGKGLTWVDDYEGSSTPDNFVLQQNYPNPFNPSTTIKYSIPAHSELAYSEPANSRQYAVGSRKKTGDRIQKSENRIKNQSFNFTRRNVSERGQQITQSNAGLISVVLKVYDILGREVATLVNTQQRPGNYEVKWDAANMPSGVYFYRIQAGDFIDTKKMLLLR